jgi:O-antigen/teichoic acid export membrane protein
MQTARTSFKRNVLYSLTGWIVPVALGVIATPIIVRSLGPHEYGIYALILGFIAYSFNFNIGRATTKYVAEYRASGDTGKIPEIISATFAVNLFVGLVGIGLILVSGPWIVGSVFQIDETLRAETLTALNISAFIIFGLMLSQVFISVIQGVNRFDVFSKIQNATSLVMISGNVLLALAGYGLIALLYWNLLATSLSVILAAISAARLLPEFSLSLRVKADAIRQVVRYSSAIVGYQIVANILLLFERGWITAKLGSEALTYYVVPMTLGMLLHGLIGSSMLTFFPIASATGSDRTQLLSLYKKASKAVTFIVVFAVVSLIALNAPIMRFWVGDDFAANSSVTLIFHSLSFGIIAIAVIAHQTAEGLGFPSFGFWMILSIMVVGLPLMVILTNPYGNIGVAAARLAGFSLMLPGIAYVERWAFARVQIGFWVKTGGMLLAAGMAAGLLQRLLVGVLPGNWFALLAVFGAGGITYGVVLLALGFLGEDEKDILRQVTAKFRG